MLSFYLKTIFVILCLHVLCGCNSQSDNSANTTSAYTAPSSKDQDLNTDETVSPTDQVSALQTALQQAELNQMRLQEQLYEQEWNISQLQDALQGTQNSANPQRQEEWEQLLLELEVLHLRGNNREQQTERQRELAKYKRQEEELGHLRRQVLSYKLLEQKVLDLRLQNQGLQHEVKKREEDNQILINSAQELERTNKDLEDTHKNKDETISELKDSDEFINNEFLILWKQKQEQAKKIEEYEQSLQNIENQKNILSEVNSQLRNKISNIYEKNESISVNFFKYIFHVERKINDYYKQMRIYFRDDAEIEGDFLEKFQEEDCYYKTIDIKFKNLNMALSKIKDKKDSLEQKEKEKENKIKELSEDKNTLKNTVTGLESSNSTFKKENKKISSELKELQKKEYEFNSFKKEINCVKMSESLWKGLWKMKRTELETFKNNSSNVSIISKLQEIDKKIKNIQGHLEALDSKEASKPLENTLCRIMIDLSKVMQAILNKIDNKEVEYQWVTRSNVILNACNELSKQLEEKLNLRKTPQSRSLKKINSTQDSTT